MCLILSYGKSCPPLKKKKNHTSVTIAAYMNIYAHMYVFGLIQNITFNRMVYHRRQWRWKNYKTVANPKKTIIIYEQRVYM